MKKRSLFVAVAWVAIASPAAYVNADEPKAAQEGDAASGLELFQQRIMPIFRSSKPSSCVQCHLASVDLKDYILPSHEQTFVSLRDQGLINVESPEESKILKLIEMGEKDVDKGARLIHARTRKAEYEAFAAWIKACCSNPKLRTLPSLNPEALARPVQTDEIIRYSRKSRVVDSFVRLIWSQRMRCFPCHTPHELDPENPQHAKPIARTKELRKQFGAKIEIFGKTPEETLRKLITNSRRTHGDDYPLINIEDPAKSLLLLKPLSKVPPKDDAGQFAKPSSTDPVTHMGGLKMHKDDQSYKAYLSWLHDYSRVVGGEYKSVEQLPADNWHPTKHVLRMRDVPAKLPTAAPVQLFLHRWDTEQEAWSPDPVAFTQGTVTPRRIVNGALFLIDAPQDALPQGREGDAKLAVGRYLVRVYADSANRLEKDPSAFLTQRDLIGQVEIRARWGEGFKQAVMFTAKELRSPRQAGESRGQ